MRERLLSGRYRLLETIGSGGMGQVWRARDEDLGRLVAVKVFAPPEDIETGERQELLRRFRREARAVAALSSPHVVTVYDHGTDGTGEDEVPYLVMELVAGQSLQEILRREVRAPVAQALDWARQTAVGLAAAHGAGIVHRDVKPANIMVTPATDTAPHGTVKILDFGIAAFLEGAEAATRLTRTGTLPIGSVLYMAPERFRQEPGDGRIDLYALGCVLYELLVGRPPFTGPAAGVMYNHLHDTPVRPSRARAEVPVAVDELIAALMAKTAADRPADAAAVLALLDGIDAAAGEVSEAGSAGVVSAAGPASTAGSTGSAGQGAGSAPASAGAVAGPGSAATPDPPTAPVPAPAPTTQAPPAPATGARAARPARRRKLLLGAVALVCVGTGVAVPAALRGGEPGSPGPAPSVRPVDQPTFRIAVVGPPRGQDGRGSKGDKSGRVDTGAVQRALEDYAGLLPLEVVGVPGDEQLTSGQFAARYPNVVAVVGPAPDPVNLPAGMPALSTCQSGRSGRSGTDDGASGDVDGGHAEQFGSYLEKELGTRSLLAMGVPVRTPDAVSPSPAAADQLRLADRFDTARRGSPYAYDVREDSPGLLPAGQLRTLIGETRPDTVYLGDEGHPQDSVRALRAAGFRGKVVLAPDRFDDCAIAAGALREEPVDDGVYRFRVVSKGPVAGSECLQDAEWCDRVRPLMTRAGALEEYEAAQAVVTAFRAGAVNDVTAATARKHIGAVVNRVRINGLQGDYTLGSRDDTGTARPVWVEHREAGAWKVLGTVAALTRD